MGIAVAFVWTFGTAFVLFQAIKATVGLRVSAEEELQGLDIGEHGASCYPDFVMSGHGSYAGARAAITEQYVPAPIGSEQPAES